MQSEAFVTLTGREAYGRRVPPASFGNFLRTFGPVNRQSVLMAFQRRSTVRGRVPSWLDRAADVRFIDHYADQQGNTVLVFEAPKLGEAAEELFLQGEFWPDRPAPTDTAVDLFADVVAAVGQGDRDSRWLDAPLLRTITRFQLAMEADFSTALLRPPRHHHAPIELDARVTEAAKSMQASAPPPQRVRLVGELDMVRLSTQTFGLKLQDGTILEGILTAGDVRDIAGLLASQVLVQGKVVYKPSGRPLRIDAEGLSSAIGESSLWSTLSAAQVPGLHGLRRPQTARTGLAAIIGRWPGEETDEEIAEALEQLS